MERYNFRLNPRLDAEALERRFAADRRVHIAQFLVEEDADALYRHLKSETSWRVTMCHGERRYELRPADLRDKQRESLNRIVRQANPIGIHYCFQTILVPDGASERSAEPTLLNIFAAFLSSVPVISLMKRITGMTDLAFAAAQATAYEPGDFLGKHNDSEKTEKRRVAYSLNLSPHWDADWGGLLLFHGADGHVDRAYTPVFNSLNLFAVPQHHSVTMVVPFAENPRYSVSGWFRAQGPLPG